MRITRCAGTLLLLAITALPAAGQAGAFGAGIALGTDEIAVAEPNTNFRPGTVYIYRRAASGWAEAAQLRAPDAERADGFGTAVARAGDVLFVAQEDGRVHAFRRNGSGWTHAQTITSTDAAESDRFGASLAASGDWLLVGAPGPAPSRFRRGGEAQTPKPGAVYAFQRTSDGRWVQRARLSAAEAGDNDAFGATLAIAGTRALVGAPSGSATVTPPARRGPPGAQQQAPEPQTVPNVGRVYELVLENGAWRVAGALDSRPVPNQAFGAALSLDGDVAVIGAPGDADGHGAAFLFRRDSETGAWDEAARLAAYSSVRSDAFGTSVALDGDDVFVGAPVNRGIERGIAYAFHARDGVVQAPQRLQLDDVTPTDNFGAHVATRDGIAAVVASGMHRNAGAVYLYERGANGAWQNTATLMSPPDALPAVTGAEQRCTEGKADMFACSDVELVAFVPNSMLAAEGRNRGIRLNDVWGWTDPQTKREYAIVGRTDGTSFVDITDPLNPVLVGDLPQPEGSPPSPTWRDMKVYRDHVYVVADAAGEHGVQVFDLTRLRNVQNAPALFDVDARYTRINSAHNIVINEESGFAYVVGASGGGESCAGGLHIMDIREPKNPQFAGCFAHDGTGRAGRGYTHDAQCVIYRGPDSRYTGREICLSSNENAVSVADVTDKSNPKPLAVAKYPNPGYTHQGWFSEDHRYFFVDDEGDLLAGNVPTTRTTVWDLRDLEDPVLANEFMGSTPASAHNLYVKGNYVYQANYRYGLQVLDISDPANPREAGHFDTAPFLEGPGFSGAWSNYPYFPSGNIIVTSVQEGMFVVKPRRPVF